MISKEISLLSIFQKSQSSLITLRNNAKNAIRLTKIESFIFSLLFYTNHILIDLTASNNTTRYFCNTVYYIYHRNSKYFYLSVALRNRGNVLTASHVNFSAIVMERECFEMFGIFFEGHKDLRKLLLDYGFIGNPLLKQFPLPGFHQISYTTHKGLIFKDIELAQVLRNFTYISPWN
jgi:NADH:ubiquinone oxidoreductase subunit C